MRGPSLQLLLLLSASLFSLASCAGFMRMRLKSEYLLNATIIVNRGNEVDLVALPMRLPAKEVVSLGPFPMDFHRNCSLFILGQRTEELAITESRYRADFEPLVGIASPIQLNLPLNGLELSFECEKNWRGPKCDEEKESGRFEWRRPAPEPRLLEVTSDYTIDLEKISMIVGRLKQTTIVENAIRKDEAKKIEEAKEREKKKKQEEEEKLKKRNQEEDEEQQMIMDGILGGYPREPPMKKIKKGSNEVISGLMSTLMTSLPGMLSFGGRRKESSSSESAPSIISSMRMKPSSFSHDSHPRPSMWGGVRDIPDIRPSSLFLDFLPRFQRHTSEGSGEVPEGSGARLNN